MKFLVIFTIIITTVYGLPLIDVVEHDADRNEIVLVESSPVDDYVLALGQSPTLLEVRNPHPNIHVSVSISGINIGSDQYHNTVNIVINEASPADFIEEWEFRSHNKGRERIGVNLECYKNP